METGSGKELELFKSRNNRKGIYVMRKERLCVLAKVIVEGGLHFFYRLGD